MSTPTRKTLDWMNKREWVHGLVEQYNHKIKRKNDLFGIFDYIALDGDYIIGVQSCDASFKAHTKTILKHREAAIKWLKGQGKILLIGWRILKIDGKDKYRPRIKFFKMEDFENGK